MPRQFPDSWAKALGALPVTVALSDSGHIVAVTNDMGRQLGVPGLDLVGRTCRDILAPFLPDCSDCPMNQNLGPVTEPNEKEALEYPQGNPGPTRRPLCLPLDGERQGFYVHLLYSSLDASRLLTLLATMDRLHLVEDRMAFLVHELNNYLTAIAGHAELILANDPRSAREHAGVIFRTVDRCHQILIKARGWRSAAPTRTNQISPLQQVVQEVLETCRFALQLNKANIVVDIEEDLPAVAMDSTELLQVLSNLVINAAQAGRHNSLQTQITLKARRRGDRIRIEVSDNGPGIPDDVKELIFEPYFTTKAKGTGLGLALAKALVERAGGTIEVSSREKGATMEVSLPIAQPRPALKQPTTGPGR